MHISIKNLGIVSTAEIELNGLTILTGNNDTGKSFIGKLVFSIIKTLKNSPEYYDEERALKIEFNFSKILQAHREVVPFNEERRMKFDTESLRDSIDEYFRDPELNKEIIEKISNYKNEVVKDIIEFTKPNLRVSNKEVDSNLNVIEDCFTIINSILTENINYENIYKLYFNKEIIKYFFENQINSFTGEKLEIIINQGPSTLLTLRIENNEVVDFKYDNANPIFQIDSTIVDTPTVLILDDLYHYFIGRSLRGRSRGFKKVPFPFNYTDILSKFDEINGSPSPIVSNPEIIEKINKIINGSVVYNSEKRNFYFVKNDGYSLITSSNIATGIKSFIVLQLLLLSGNINSDSILIIDEPEVHLHPKWEIEYAKIVVELSKAGIPIIISTHSPYFLQATVKYVKDNNTEDITKFYFGESSNKGNNVVSEFKDVTEDLEPIFKALADPMRKIYFN